MESFCLYIWQYRVLLLTAFIGLFSVHFQVKKSIFKKHNTQEQSYHTFKQSFCLSCLLLFQRDRVLTVLCTMVNGGYDLNCVGKEESCGSVLRGGTHR